MSSPSRKPANPFACFAGCRPAAAALAQIAKSAMQIAQQSSEANASSRLLVSRVLVGQRAASLHSSSSARQPPHSNPHSASRPANLLHIAVSFIEGFRTPAPVQAASSPWAGIRNPQQKRTKGWHDKTAYWLAHHRVKHVGPKAFSLTNIWSRDRPQPDSRTTAKIAGRVQLP